MLTKLALVALAGIGSMAALGCGGDGDRLSRAEFIEQADANCEETVRALSAVGVPQSDGEFDEWAVRLKPDVQRILDEQKALKPPEDLEDDWNAWIANGSAFLDDLDDLKEAGASEDSQRIQEIGQELEQRSLENERLAKAMGLRFCSQGVE